MKKIAIRKDCAERFHMDDVTPADEFLHQYVITIDDDVYEVWKTIRFQTELLNNKLREIYETPDAKQAQITFGFEEEGK